MAAIETPDWLKATVFMGDDSGTLRLVAVDASGQLYAVTKGKDGTGALHPLAVDADGQLIMVPRGQGGNYMAVDANGFLTTILKGDYEGTLRTVMLDDDGRMSAFVVDSSDVWEQIVKVGNAELAARLGGLPKYHRTGQVTLVESFEYGLGRWIPFLGGTGAKVALSPECPASGGYCAHLVGGSDYGHYVWLEHHSHIMPAGRVGVSFGFAIPAGGLVQEIRLLVRCFTGAFERRGGVRFDDTSDNLDYWTSAGVWSKIDDAPLTARTKETYNRVKLVIDLETLEYVSMYFNQEKYDLSGVALYSSATPVSPAYWVSIELYSRAGYNDDIYVDDVILTVAEQQEV